MKVIFLDMDGVLNTEQTFMDIHKEWKETGKRRAEVDEWRVKLLGDLVKDTGAIVIMSSTWRGGWIPPLNGKTKEANDIFEKYGVEIYDITPSIYRNGISWREDEINYWLSRHPCVEAFVIFDDELFDLTSYKDTNLIRTSTMTLNEDNTYSGEVQGLMPEHIEKARAILMR